MSESSQLHFRCWKQQVEDSFWGVYAHAPHSVAMPCPESDHQEDDQIASWLRFPSDSNNDNNTILLGPDSNKEQTMMGSNNKACMTMLHPTEGMKQSTSLAKRNDVVNVSEEKVGPSHATRGKKKGKDKGRCQVGELGSRKKGNDILEPTCILPKRLRAPEVHRLNERRRRDKINEKIKTLQELIPRCSKQLDKASTLDKAIGYMKDLQMQVRMMSPGYDIGTQMLYGMAGPYMPSMSMCTDMSTPALQAIHANMNTMMCLGPGLMPIGPALQYPHKSYQAPMHMLPQHDVASSMILFPQVGDPRIFPSSMQGNFLM